MRRSFKVVGGTVLVLLLAAAVTIEPISVRLDLLLRGNPNPVSALSIDRGRNIFVENCAICHGDRGDGKGELSADLLTRPVNFGTINRPPSVLAMSIQFGVGQDMPAWRGVLQDEDIWDVVNYLETLARNGQGRATDQWWRPRFMRE